MRYSHVCALAFVLAFVEFLTATPGLGSRLQLEKEPSLDALAHGPAPSNDDQFITRSGSLRSRDLDQARTKDLMSLKEHSKRSANIYNHVRSMPRFEAGYSLSVSERSLLTDIATTGFRLVWDSRDIAYASYIAFHQTTELWANMTANARGKWKDEKQVMTLDISYGSLKLSIAGLMHAISWELVAGFAVEMLVLSRIVVFGAFRVFLFANWAVMVITLAIAVQVFGTIKPQQLITGP
ncbi:MAG: hypothetical protein Q9175_000964 [Cornicularia normoerica]